jgi:hypothetical protein
VSEIFTNPFHGHAIETINHLIRRHLFFWHTLCIYPFDRPLGEAGVVQKTGEFCEMGSEDGPVAMLATLALLVISIVLLRLLPSQLLTILTAWIFASFPIGVLIGHCVLSEK